MTFISKKQKIFRDAIDRNKFYTLEDAVALLQKFAKNRNFNETIDIAMNLGVDPRHADQMVRGMVALPKGTGKMIRVAVFAKDAKADEARQAGADIVGAEDLAERILAGDLQFERCIATPDMMALVGRLGKVLGPKGLMPNPKLGTVTPDVAGAVKAAKGGAIEFRVEKTGIVHAGLGKAHFETEGLLENIRAFHAAIVKAKPTGSKGVYIRKVVLSSTMGPGLKIDLSSFAEADRKAA